uniref:Ig-like domain-containing protein n=1 Tax=Nothobranchius furzeri TaxID=105023 RepID=A0A8C6LRF8_NOTFU
MLTETLLYRWNIECKGDKVVQDEGGVAAEGTSTTLPCTFDKSDYFNVHLFWYKQEENQIPKYALYRDTIGTSNNAPEFSKGRFEAAITGNSVPLKIQRLHVTDSAVYYCAVSEMMLRYVLLTLSA